MERTATQTEHETITLKLPVSLKCEVEEQRMNDTGAMAACLVVGTASK